MENNEENTNYRGTSNNDNNLAIVGFVLSFFIPIAGLIVSIFGLKKSKELNDKGKGLSIAGIVISTIALVFWLLGIILFCLLFITIVDTGGKVIDKVSDKVDNYLQCTKAYNCKERSNGTYKCKYEDEKGKEITITCDEYSISDSISDVVGEWTPYKITDEIEEYSIENYFGDKTEISIIFNDDYTFIDNATRNNLESKQGKFVVQNEQIVLTYDNGIIKYIDTDYDYETNIMTITKKDSDGLTIYLKQKIDNA